VDSGEPHLEALGKNDFFEILNGFFSLTTNNYFYEEKKYRVANKGKKCFFLLERPCFLFLGDFSF